MSGTTSDLSYCGWLVRYLHTLCLHLLIRRNIVSLTRQPRRVVPICGQGTYIEHRDTSIEVSLLIFSQSKHTHNWSWGRKYLSWFRSDGKYEILYVEYEYAVCSRVDRCMQNDWDCLTQWLTPQIDSSTFQVSQFNNYKRIHDYSRHYVHTSYQYS